MKRYWAIHNISRNKVIIMLFIIMLCFIVSCDAPHDNPLDPESDNPISILLNKDNLTTIHEFAVYSEHLAPLQTGMDPDEYYIVSDIVVEDEDVISSVILEIADTLFFAMTPLDDIQAGLYRYILDPKNFGKSINFFRHAEVFAHIYDDANFQVISERGLITAIHNNPPQPLLPALGDTTSITPTFIWRGPPDDNEFYSHFLLEVWEESSSNPIQTYSRNFINDQSAGFGLLDTIVVPSEKAFNRSLLLSWTIKIVDEHGNSSRSPKIDFFTERTSDQ
jgi:hypothetical protein